MKKALLLLVVGMALMGVSILMMLLKVLSQQILSIIIAIGRPYHSVHMPVDRLII